MGVDGHLDCDGTCGSEEQEIAVSCFRLLVLLLSEVYWDFVVLHA